MLIEHTEYAHCTQQQMQGMVYGPGTAGCDGAVMHITTSAGVNRRAHTCWGDVQGSRLIQAGACRC